MKPLTIKQENFAQEYVRNEGKASLAYIHAFSTKNMIQDTINNKGSVMARKDTVRARIDFLRENIKNKAELKMSITFESQLKDFQDIANRNPIDWIKDFKGDTMKFKDKDEIPRELWMLVDSIKPTAHGIELKFYSRVEALKEINKMQGYHAASKVETKIVDEFEGMTDEELKKLGE